MTALSAENEVPPARADPQGAAGALAVSGASPARSPCGGARSDRLAVPVRLGGDSGPEQPAGGLGEPISLGWPPRALRIDHRLWLVGEQRTGHLPDVFETVGTGEQ